MEYGLPQVTKLPRPYPVVTRAKSRDGWAGKGWAPDAQETSIKGLRSPRQMPSTGGGVGDHSSPALRPSLASSYLPATCGITVSTGPPK
jgi:hypothetical protein